MLDFEKRMKDFNAKIYTIILFAAVNICFGQSIWKLVASLPQGKTLHSVAYGNNQFVAVGEGILSSPDAIAWTIRRTAQSLMIFNSVIYGNGQFVAVGSDAFPGIIAGAIYTSSDSDISTWTNRGIPVSNFIDFAFYSIIYKNSTFIITAGVGDTPQGDIFTSNDAITWTRKGGASNSFFYSVIFNNSFFVAVGSGGGIFTSPDTSIWTKRNSKTTKDLNSIVHGDNQFVAVGAEGTILTSPDDSTWTIRSSGTTNALNSIILGNSQFVVVGDSGRILTSPDAVSWTIRNSGTIKALRGIVYADSQFVAVGDSGVILTSKADGTGIAFHSKSYMPDNGRIKIKSSNSGISITLPNATAPGLLKIELFTVAGKRVYSATSWGTNGVLKIPASGFPAGMYYLSIEDNHVSAKSAAFILAR